MRVQVADGGSTPLTDIGLLVFNIKRNLNAPSFETPTTFSIRLLEIQDIGVELQRVIASDADQEVGQLFYVMCPIYDVPAWKYVLTLT